MDSETLQDVQEIQISMEEAQQQIAQDELLTQLEQHPAFKQLIVDQYFNTEPTRLVFLLGDPSMQNEQQQKAIQADMAAIAAFRNYLILIKRRAHIARGAIAESEQELETIENEMEEEAEA